MSADTVRPCSVMGYPPFPVALVHTQMLGGGARPGYAQKTRSLSLKVFLLLLEVFEDFKK